MFLRTKLPSVYRSDAKAQRELLRTGYRKALRSGRWWALQLVDFLSLAVYMILMLRYMFPVAYLVFTAWLCVHMIARHFRLKLLNGFILDANPHLCRACGYDLTGNASGICPECGTPLQRTPEVAA